MTSPADSPPSSPSGWCAACGVRVESGECAPGVYIPPPPRDDLRCLYLLCRRCHGAVDGFDEEARQAVLEAVELRIYYGRPSVA